MKTKYLFYSKIIISLLSCNNKENKVSETKVVSTSLSTGNCTEVFKEFRDNIYQKRKNKVKSYFSFPVRDENIWFAVLDDNSVSEGSLKKDFTANDFDNYYSKLFPTEFIQSLLKIKSKELFHKGIYSTPPIIKKDNDWQIKIYIVAEYKKGILTLSLNYEYYHDDVKTESSAIYYFTIDDNCTIKFEHLMLAG